MKNFPKLPGPGAKPEEIIHFQEQLLEFARETGDQIGEGHTLIGLAQVNLMQGNLQRGIEYAQEALKVALKTGDRNTQAHSLYQISMASMSHGVVTDTTIKMAREALRIFEQMGDPTADLVRPMLKKYDKKKWQFWK
jgi:hypothetical protein